MNFNNFFAIVQSILKGTKQEVSTLNIEGIEVEEMIN